MFYNYDIYAIHYCEVIINHETIMAIYSNDEDPNVETWERQQKAWTVITPAGNIYVASKIEADEYKKLYGYVVVKTKKYTVARTKK